MPPTDYNELILTELRGLRTEVTQGFSEIHQRVTAIETHTQPFFETDGGKDKLRRDIDELKSVKWTFYGIVLAITGGFHALLHKIGL